MKLFRNEVEGLEARLLELRTAATAAEGQGEAARTEAATAQAAAVDALVAGASVADFEERRDAAEERSRKAIRTAAAHRDAITAVEGKLEAAQAEARKKALLEDLAAAKKASAKALRDLTAAVPTFADALARAKRSEQAAESAVRGLLGEGVPTRNQDPEGFELPAGPSAVAVAEEAFSVALPVAPEGGYSTVDLHITIPA